MLDMKSLISWRELLDNINFSILYAQDKMLYNTPAEPKLSILYHESWLDRVLNVLNEYYIIEISSCSIISVRKDEK